MAKIKRLWYNRTCSKTKVELFFRQGFLQIILNGNQIAAFDKARVLALLGERSTTDAADGDQSLSEGGQE